MKPSLLLASEPSTSVGALLPSTPGCFQSPGLPVLGWAVTVGHVFKFVASDPLSKLPLQGPSHLLCRCSCLLPDCLRKQRVGVMAEGYLCYSVYSLAPSCLSLMVVEMREDCLLWGHPMQQAESQAPPLSRPSSWVPDVSLPVRQTDGCCLRV